jgi:hypothetical protein
MAEVREHFAKGPFRRIVVPRIRQETVAVDDSAWEDDELSDET